jgi:hypothetical protein
MYGVIFTHVNPSLKAGDTRFAGKCNRVGYFQSNRCQTGGSDKTAMEKIILYLSEMLFE